LHSTFKRQYTSDTHIQNQALLINIRIENFGLAKHGNLETAELKHETANLKIIKF